MTKSQYWSGTSRKLNAIFTCHFLGGKFLLYFCALFFSGAGGINVAGHTWISCIERSWWSPPAGRRRQRRAPGAYGVEEMEYGQGGPCLSWGCNPTRRLHHLEWDTGNYEIYVCGACEAFAKVSTLGQGDSHIFIKVQTRILELEYKRCFSLFWVFRWCWQICFKKKEMAKPYYTVRIKIFPSIWIMSVIKRTDLFRCILAQCKV